MNFLELPTGNFVASISRREFAMVKQALEMLSNSLYDQGSDDYDEVQAAYDEIFSFAAQNSIPDTFSFGDDVVGEGPPTEVVDSVKVLMADLDRMPQERRDEIMRRIAERHPNLLDDTLKQRLNLGEGENEQP